MAGVLLAVQAVYYSKLMLPVYMVVGGASYLLTLRLLKVAS
jgi:hypothetical protein